MPSRRSNAGFTLIELLLVISILAIVAGLVIPSSNPTLHDQLLSAARILSSDLAYARSLAVTNGDRYKVTLDAAGNRYLLQYSGTNPSLTALPNTPFRNPTDPPHQQIVNLADLPHLDAPVQVVAVAAVGSTTVSISDIEFGPLGQTTRSDTTCIWLSCGVGAGTRYITLSVNPVTGLTTLGDYTGVGPPASLGRAASPLVKAAPAETPGLIERLAARPSREGIVAW